MHAILLFALFQQHAAAASSSSGVGTEWMVIASILVPMALLILLGYLGRSRSV